jgi:short-subunit dehydrogenase
MARVALKNRTIWITGASSGIGRSMAEKLIQSGNRLIITARNENALTAIKKAAPDQVEVVVADIADPNSITHMQERLEAVTDQLDTVILNAGTCEYLDVSNYDTDLIERVIQVNLLGMSRCIQASLDLLKSSSTNPHIVGISSAAALTGLPRAEAYGASKAGVVSFLESLGLDLHRYGIDVSIVYPGFVETPLTDRNDFPMPYLMDADTAVGLIIDGIEKRKIKITFPRRLIWSLKLMAALPEKLRFKAGLSMVRNQG